MSKSKTDDKPKTQEPKAPLRKFFVAGVGAIEAASVEEVQKKLNEKQEVGDGNS